MQLYKVTQGVPTEKGGKDCRSNEVLPFLIEAENPTEALRVGHELAYAVRYQRGLVGDREGTKRPEEWAMTSVNADGQRVEVV